MAVCASIAVSAVSLNALSGNSPVAVNMEPSDIMNDHNPFLQLRDRPVLRMHLWLETEQGIVFGLGRLRLLEYIQSGHSLKVAAKHLGMSYRAAWGKIKKTEKVIGVPLIEKKHGNRAGYQLTRQGNLLTAHFSLWFKDVEAYALHRANELFLCNAKGFEEKKIDSSNHPS